MSGIPSPSRSPLPDDLRMELALFLASARSVESPPSDLEEAVRQQGPTFHERLWECIRRDGRTESEIYREAGLSPNQFARLRARTETAPDRRVVVSLIVALGLGLADASRLMASAGYTFSPASKFDLIVRFFLERGETDVNRINDALHVYAQPLVCGVEE